LRLIAVQIWKIFSVSPKHSDKKTFLHHPIFGHFTTKLTDKKSIKE
jgi:hypothetical protein